VIQIQPIYDEAGKHEYIIKGVSKPMVESEVSRITGLYEDKVSCMIVTKGPRLINGEYVAHVVITSDPTIEDLDKARS